MKKATHQKTGNIEKAKDFAEVLIEVSPWDENAKALLKKSFSVKMQPTEKF